MKNHDSFRRLYVRKISKSRIAKPSLYNPLWSEASSRAAGNDAPVKAGRTAPA
jgi:hypothetical protein